jgi:hypothetical protein
MAAESWPPVSRAAVCRQLPPYSENCTSPRRVLMHQYEATMDRIESGIRLIAKGVGLDHVDPG